MQAASPVSKASAMNTVMPSSVAGYSTGSKILGISFIVEVLVAPPLNGQADILGLQRLAASRRDPINPSATRHNPGRLSRFLLGHYNPALRIDGTSLVATERVEQSSPSVQKEGPEQNGQADPDDGIAELLARFLAFQPPDFFFNSKNLWFALPKI